VSVPAAVLDAAGEHVEGGFVPESVTRVGGGDINQAATVGDRSGTRWFVKWNRSAPAGMFEAELDGLKAFGKAAEGLSDLLRVPRPLAAGTAAGVGWLVMEVVSPAAGSQASPDRGWEARLGRGLADLHRRTAEEAGVDYGWRRDNWIGRLPQHNPASDDWPAFWRDHRLAPQVEAAHAARLLRDAERAELDELLDRMDAALGDAADDGASLLHGDLWGGNVMGCRDGRAAIYDPAVYRGHREVDLAMSELFGFPPGFLPAYREAWPVDPAYDEVRRDVYQLYYLLVHVNLFGRSYAAGAMASARRVLERA